jgi:hypothetical protein
LLSMQVVRSKHKVRAFVFSPATKRGGLAQLALSLANNTIEVCTAPFYLYDLMLFPRAQAGAPAVLMWPLPGAYAVLRIPTVLVLWLDTQQQRRHMFSLLRCGTWPRTA